MNKYMLNGEWQLKNEEGQKIWYCTIPGSVLSGMLEHDMIEDPYYRMNEYPTRELLRKDYMFERTFTYEKKSDAAHYELVCDGIDTVADIYLNEQMIGHVENMHLQYVIDISKQLIDGENTICIQMQSPITYVDSVKPESEDKEISFINTGTMPNSQYLRKAHSMFGWDWGPQLPDMGIFRDIYIREWQDAIIEDVSYIQEHKDGKVTIEANMQIRIAGQQIVSPEQFEKMTVDYEILDEHLMSLGHFTEGTFTVKNPSLWWPRGFGEQPLYTIKATLLMDGVVLDEKVLRIGLRTMTVSLTPDEYGDDFAFCVNGVRIFAKGADYIPQDCIYSRITKEKIYDMIASSAWAGFNCIRVWGGGYYPSEYFYDVCDELGIMVWQDFMFACNIYELTDAFRENVVQECRYNIRRLRHHASLALWCGNNEMEYAWLYWDDVKDHSQALKQDYVELFEHVIADVVKEEDPHTFYWPSSPSAGGGFQDLLNDSVGDSHYWEVWHGEKPFTDYENHNFRFCSEFGFQSFPEMKTIESFTLPDERNIFSEVMESHQKNGVANGKILKYISDNFRYPRNLEFLIYVSQIMQGIAMKTGVDYWRRHRGQCMGALYWQLNDNWPVASWASIDYYGRYKALHYMAKRFFADIVGSAQMDGYRFTPYVQNETLQDSQTEVTMMLRDMESNVLWTEEQLLCANGCQTVCGNTYDVTQYVTGNENTIFLQVVCKHTIKDEQGNMKTTHNNQVYFFKPYKHLQLAQTKINASVKVIEEEQLAEMIELAPVNPNMLCDSYKLVAVTLSVKTPAFFVEVSMKEFDARWSDNYFDLMGGNGDFERINKYTVYARIPKDYYGPITILAKSLCDSFE